MILLFSVKLHWLPTGGTATVGQEFTLVDGMKHLIMPLAVLTLVRTAGWMRYLRSSMLEVLRQDYIRTAQAKGLTDRSVLVRHALRNALTPIITLLGLSLPDIFAGAIITEQIFNWRARAARGLIRVAPRHAGRDGARDPDRRRDRRRQPARRPLLPIR